MAIYRQAVNSVYIVGRLSTHWSVHYQRFLGLPRYTFNCPACATITRRITYMVAGKAWERG